jgi:hypothetical protein
MKVYLIKDFLKLYRDFTDSLNGYPLLATTVDKNPKDISKWPKITTRSGK